MTMGDDYNKRIYLVVDFPGCIRTWFRQGIIFVMMVRFV